jgi:uncharacterized protein
MRLPAEDLGHLDAVLQSLAADGQPMTLSELDGYVTGVLLCPDRIPATEWLPEVWGVSGKIKCADQKAADATIGAVMAHYDNVDAMLSHAHYITPVYEEDQETGTIQWDAWIKGFMRALALRRALWNRLVDQAETPFTEAMIFLMTLRSILQGESTFDEDEHARILTEAPDMIPECIAAIVQQSRPDLVPASPPRAPGTEQSAPQYARPGRNDPCPCGSGRKYKGCCGKN